MPPSLVARLGRKAGFQSVRILPCADALGTQLYARWGDGGGKWSAFVRYLKALTLILLRKRSRGMTVLRK